MSPEFNLHHSKWINNHTNSASKRAIVDIHKVLWHSIICTLINKYLDTLKNTLIYTLEYNQAHICMIFFPAPLIEKKNKTGKMGYILRADGRGFTVEGLVHQPLCGLPTDGFPVRSRPRVNISILILYSLSRSPSACTHLFHSSKSRWYFLSKCYIHGKKKCFPQTLNAKNLPNGDSLNS